MMQYRWSMAGGESRDTIEAESLSSALAIALDWVEDWAEERDFRRGTENQYGGVGDPVIVRVWREDGGVVVEEEETSYTVQTLGDMRLSEEVQATNSKADLVPESNAERAMLWCIYWLWHQFASTFENGTRHHQWLSALERAESILQEYGMVDDMGRPLEAEQFPKGWYMTDRK